MKQFILTLFFLAPIVAMAQLTFPDDLTITGSAETTDFDHHFQVKNETDQEVSAYWELITSDDFPSEWSTFLCDNNSCYTSWIKNCPESKPNVFASGVSNEWILHLRPNQVAGSAQVTIRIHYPQASGDSTIVDHVFNITAETTSNTVEVDVAQLLIYPNPTSDFFQIQQDDAVAKIGVYNVVGKEMMMLEHSTGQSHNIQHLNKGIYLVRLLDAQGSVLKSMKLSRN